MRGTSSPEIGWFAARQTQKSRERSWRASPRTADEPERALAERGRVDQQVAAGTIEHDVLALVLERLVQLEDPRAQLVNVYLITPYSPRSGSPVML